MSTQVLSSRHHSTDSSPNAAATINYFPQVPQVSQVAACTSPTAADLSSPMALLKKPISRTNSSSSRPVPALIITDASKSESNPQGNGATNATNATNTSTNFATTSLSSLPLSHSKLPTPPRVTSPTFFNTKKLTLNTRALPLEVLPITVDELSVELLAHADTIVVDVRPYTSYLHSRLLNSLNMCVPTTLLKRKSFALSNMIGSMQQSQQEYINGKLALNSTCNFILYDDASTTQSCSFHLYQTCLKIIDFQNTAALPSVCSIRILQNGISSVTASHRDLLDLSADPVLLSPISPTMPGHANDNMGANIHSAAYLSLSLRSSQSPVASSTSSCCSNDLHRSAATAPSLCRFALPSANDFSSTFAASIKKNRELHGTQYLSENDVVHLPKDSRLTQGATPKWLLPLLDPTLGFKLVQSRFLKIEDIESTRLENVARLNVPGAAASDADCHQSCCAASAEGTCSPSVPCPDCDQIRYTLPEGIEYGDKNRYSNVWPYEHSRVTILNSPLVGVLPQLPQHDYFNANYVTVPKISKNRYIATQAPLPSTFNDFWRAVWYNKVEIIICLTNLDENGIKKSDNYWQDLVYESGIEVSLQSENVDDRSSKTVVRTLQVKKNQESKLVKHIEYKDWPDFGVPPSPESIIKLIELKNSFVNDEMAPIVVHCSAGCGRTGTFITVDVLLQMFWRSLLATSSKLETPLLRKNSLRSPFGQLDRQLLFQNKLDNSEAILKKYKFWGDDDLVYKTVNILRRQRLSMVQTLNQYLICYETILKAIDDAYKNGVLDASQSPADH